MAEPVDRAFWEPGGGGEKGFTLLEVLMALGILVLGVSILLGVFAGGLQKGQSSELLREASRLALAVQEKLLNEGGLGKAGEALPQPVRDASLPDHPWLVYDLDFDGDLDRALHVTITVRWLERGEETAEEFRFVAPRGRPLSVRIREAREAGRDG